MKASLGSCSRCKNVAAEQSEQAKRLRDCPWHQNWGFLGHPRCSFSNLCNLISGTISILRSGHFGSVSVECRWNTPPQQVKEQKNSYSHEFHDLGGSVQKEKQSAENTPDMGGDSCILLRRSQSCPAAFPKTLYKWYGFCSHWHNKNVFFSDASIADSETQNRKDTGS